MQNCNEDVWKRHFYSLITLLEFHCKATTMLLGKKNWPKRGVVTNPHFWPQSLHFAALSSSKKIAKEKVVEKDVLIVKPHFHVFFPSANA